MKLTIDHIEQGRECSSGECPVALCLIENLPDVGHVEVHPDCVFLDDVPYCNSRELHDIIDIYDNGEGMSEMELFIDHNEREISCKFLNKADRVT